jgi:hypothetical protein
MDISKNAKAKKTESGPSEFVTSEDPPIDIPKKTIKKLRKKLKKNDIEALTDNRQSFLKFNRFKIHRNLVTLSEIDQIIFLTIPRLLHVHQEGLPGYFEGDPPCGIHNFTLNQKHNMPWRKCFQM